MHVAPDEQLVRTDGRSKASELDRGFDVVQAKSRGLARTRSIGLQCRR